MKLWHLLLLLPAFPVTAQITGAEMFEKDIRPVFVEKCFGCHSAKLKAPMGGLVLDTKAGLQKGGASGPIVIPGNPTASKLMRALSYTDSQIKMPPTGKLSDNQIAAFERWIAAGAPDPRVDMASATAAAPAPRRGMDIETGRKWWSFQPVLPLTPPSVANSGWVKTKIDAFILAKLEAAKLKPSAEADRRTLIKRAYLDLTGLKPTYQEVQAFVADSDPNAYRALIDRLLASPRYGERWGRNWMDVARFAEDNPTSEATNPAYPFAWRYRDWIIDAVNQDVPYDRFVKLQLAADQMPDAKRTDLAALGFLGAAPTYHKDGRLSKEVIETIYSDDWDERVDTIGRGLLGLSVACARCHDHKFDPIVQKDYYGLASVFASTMAVPRPLVDIDPQTETKFMAAAQRIFYLSYISNLMKNEPGTKPEESAKKSKYWGEEEQKTRTEMEALLKDKYPELQAYLSTLGNRRNNAAAAAANAAQAPAAQANAAPAPAAEANAAQVPAPIPPPPAAAAAQRFRGRPSGSTEPFVNAVFDAGLWIDGSDPDLTMLDVKPGVPRDLPVFQHGNVANPGDPAPRSFVRVLAKSDPLLTKGSGRLELADRIFSEAAPLAARVIVNRVWGWHFGQPLVTSPSDFGSQGDKPTHPELLDDLAARFIANGWSLKWLHREIMLSAAYQQASKPREDALETESTNKLLWRMNPRRLDIEAFRDSILEVAGNLDLAQGGPSLNLDLTTNLRRTVYSTVSRGRLNGLLQLYDFPDAAFHAPARELTTTPLQQLFVMNSPFLQMESEALVKSVATDETNDAKTRAMYRRIFQRDPTPKEMDLAQSYLFTNTLEQYAQALLSTNEVIFWP